MNKNQIYFCNSKFMNIVIFYWAARSCSQTTLDSLEWGCGGSDEGGGGGAGEDKLHLLEFELRKARETINALRNTLTQATASGKLS